MQRILSVDVSSDPAYAVVTEVQGSFVQVIESYSAFIGDTFLRMASGTASTPIASEELDAIEKAGTSESVFDAETAPQSGATALDQKATTSAIEVYRIGALAPLLSQVKSEWTSSILIIPPHDYISLTMQTPFNDQKSLVKVLDMEVQDLVPFELSEFHLQYSVLPNENSPLHDVHVSLIPRNYLRHVLKHCKESEFEPVAISTPASVLAAVNHLASNYVATDSAVMLAHHGYVYVCTCIDGQVRGERVIHLSALTPNPTGEYVPKPAVLSEIKLTLSASERRFERNLSKIYLIGNTFSPRELQQGLGRDVELLKVADVVRAASDEIAIPSLASVFMQDQGGPPLLTNFRSREFAYSPQLKELVASAKSLLPFLAGLLIMVTIFWVGRYYANSYRIQAMHDAIQRQVRAELPNLSKDHPASLLDLDKENTDLETQLHSLISPSEFSPLDAFYEISQDISQFAGVEVRMLKIQTDRMTVELTAPDYSAVDKIKKALGKKGQIYCKFESSSAPSSTGLGFSFDIKLCER